MKSSNHFGGVDVLLNSNYFLWIYNREYPWSMWSLQRFNWPTPILCVTGKFVDLYRYKKKSIMRMYAISVALTQRSRANILFKSQEIHVMWYELFYCNEMKVLKTNICCPIPFTKVHMHALSLYVAFSDKIWSFFVFVWIWSKQVSKFHKALLTKIPSQVQESNTYPEKEDMDVVEKSKLYDYHKHLMYKRYSHAIYPKIHWSG